MKQSKHLSRLRCGVRMMRVAVRFVSADVLSLRPARADLERDIAQMARLVEQMAIVTQADGAGDQPALVAEEAR